MNFPSVSDYYPLQALSGLAARQRPAVYRSRLSGDRHSRYHLRTARDRALSCPHCRCATTTIMLCSLYLYQGTCAINVTLRWKMFYVRFGTIRTSSRLGGLFYLPRSQIARLWALIPNFIIFHLEAAQTNGRQLLMGICRSAGDKSDIVNRNC